MTRSQTNGNRRKAEAWWPLLRDMGCFGLGSGILIAQVLEQTPEPVLVGAGLALIGVTGTGRVQEWAKGRKIAREEQQP
jgi:hypothetical protein